MNAGAQGRTMKLRTTILALGVAGVCSAAGAQVVRTQDGRVLDANYRVGSGGYNTPVQPWAPINSQYYVTGQVSGLGGFRGRLDYRAADELRLDVPSAGLGSFRQQSVGLPQVLTGRPYMTSAYLDPSRVMLSMPAIEAGLSIPGSSIPVSPTLPASVANRLYREATEAYEPLFQPQPGRATAVEPIRYAPSLPPPPTVAEGAIPSNLPEWRTAAASIYGIPRPEITTDLAAELRGLVPDEIVARLEQRPAGEEAPEGKELIEPVPPTETTLGGNLRPDQPPAEDDMLRKPYPLEMGEQAAAAPLPPPGQDVFTDLLIRMREHRAAAERRRRSETPTEPEPRRHVPKPQPALPNAFEEHIAAEPAGPRYVLRSLAGSGDDSFNRVMLDGERLLRDGRYYEAAERYRAATILAPGNPLARVGLGLSLFAAGEPLTASNEFRRALQLFPPLMETRVKLDGLLPERLVTATLDRFQIPPERTAPRAGLMALLHTFMLRNLGDESAARQAATTLAETAGDDALLAAYAEFVLTGNRPADQE